MNQAKADACENLRVKLARAVLDFTEEHGDEFNIIEIFSNVIAVFVPQIIDAFPDGVDKIGLLNAIHMDSKLRMHRYARGEYEYEHDSNISH